MHRLWLESYYLNGDNIAPIDAGFPILSGILALHFSLFHV